MLAASVAGMMEALMRGSTLAATTLTTQPEETPKTREEISRDARIAFSPPLPSK